MYAFDGQTCKGDSMATNREPIRLKPWHSVVEAEIDRIRDELEEIARRLANAALAVEARILLKHRRAELEQDFQYLLAELHRPQLRQMAEPKIVERVDPLDDGHLMMARAAAVERLRAQAECAA